MKQVHECDYVTDAYLIASILNDNGVPAIVQGEALASAAGELPLLGNAGPGVWVVNDSDAPRAIDILRENERSRTPVTCPKCGENLRAAVGSQCPQCGTQFRNAMPKWGCPGCGELIEEQFAECWKCGSARADASDTGR